VPGPRTPGADDYDGSGTLEQVETELADAINDSKNSKNNKNNKNRYATH